MHQSEVERILGVTSNIRGYVTGKAFIPFYFGSDSHRYEAVYAGQGSVAYTGGGMGGGPPERGCLRIPPERRGYPGQQRPQCHRPGQGPGAGRRPAQ